MRWKSQVPVLILLSIMLSSCGAKQIKDLVKGWIGEGPPKRLETRRLSLYEFEDKLRGAWAGKMIGVAYAGPYEFKYQGEMIPEGVIRAWEPGYVESALQQDDLYVQMTFLEALEDKGFQITSREAADYFGKTEYPLWHANRIARENIRAGIYPPESGHPSNNPHADDIDFQIEADVFGIISPGLPIPALKLAETFGTIMNYGDGVYGGLFVTGMYSAAYFENDRIAVIEQGLKGIPAKSHYAQLIRDVLDFYRANPSDWQACWNMLQEKWASDDLCPAGMGKPFNIDAKLNGGYVILGLLYGEGDFNKTLEISTRCGQDNDCNASTAAGILGTIQGYSRIPHSYKVGIPVLGSKRFLHTRYNFTTLIQTCRKMATNLIERYAGKIQRLGDREYYAVPVQRQKTPTRVEQFTVDMATRYRDRWASLETERYQRFMDRLNEQLASWEPGWTISDCGHDMNPGLRDTYAEKFDVFVTHPKNKETPCTLSWKGILSSEKPVLSITAAASNQHPEADWILRVRINGTILAEEIIGLNEGKVQWRELRYDLSRYAGQAITIQLEQIADEWNFEAAYWDKVEFVK